MDFDSFKNTFAYSLRQFRNERKISAREMSLELGQNVNYINYIENGRHLPSMQGFYLICEYLKIQPQDFFKEKISEEMEDLEYFNSLSKSQQHLIVTFMKEIMKNK